VLLSCQHKDGEDQLGSKEHLNEETLRNAGASTESSPNVKVTRKHALDQASRSHTTKNLSDEQKATTDPGEGTNQTHSECDLYGISKSIRLRVQWDKITYGWIEQTTTDSEEDPSIYSK
jgi:hypothetical protein